MSSFTLLVIMSFLMIAGGIALLATPLLTFLSTGYFIIILFLIAGIFGIIRGVSEKRYGRDFIFAVISLILGIVGFLVPGAAAMTNNMLVYMAAAWFILHGLLTIATAIVDRKENKNTAIMVVSIIFGILEVVLGCYSFANPAMLATGIGILIGLYYIETGVRTLIVETATCEGGNPPTVLFTFLGLAMIVTGACLLDTPLLTFLQSGYWIIIFFFVHGVVGLIRAIREKRRDREFWFAILSLILGIAGFLIPGAALMNNFVLLYMAAAWFIVHGVLLIMTAIEAKKKGAEGIVVFFMIVLGVLEIILGIYSAVHPAVGALNVGILIGFYFIESGVQLILIGSTIADAVAAAQKAYGMNR